MTKKLKLIAVFLLLAAFCAPACLAYPTFYGSLSSADGGIVGINGWTTNPDNPVTFTWSIFSPGFDGRWLYVYEFDIDLDLQGGLSHLIIEVSEDLVNAEIVNPDPSIEGDDPKWYYGDPQGTSNTNPYMPDDVFGIKFGITNGEGSTTMSFYTKRNPVWGDFYAKDGDPGGAVWNAGFTNPDSDPTEPPIPWSNVCIGYHILVPDTTYIIPVPGAILLGSIGVGLVGWLRRRRTL